MDDIIAQLDTVRIALGTLSITSTRRNLDVLLGSMQALDLAISALQRIGCAEKHQEKEVSDHECDQD